MELIYSIIPVFYFKFVTIYYIIYEVKIGSMSSVGIKKFDNLKKLIQLRVF